MINGHRLHGDIGSGRLRSGCPRGSDAPRTAMGLFLPCCFLLGTGKSKNEGEGRLRGIGLQPPYFLSSLMKNGSVSSSTRGLKDKVLARVAHTEDNCTTGMMAWSSCTIFIALSNNSRRLSSLVMRMATDIAASAASLE